MKLRSRLIQANSRASLHYPRHAILAKEVSNRLISRLSLIRFQPKSMLDLGAGTGILTHQLERQFPKVPLYVIDITLPMLTQARRHKPWFSSQRYIVADAHTLPFPDHSIDFICSNFLFEWTPDINKIIAEIYRVMKPGGLLLFSTLGRDTLKELKQSWASVDHDIHVNPLPDMHDIGDNLVQAGFQDPVVDMEFFTLRYPTVKHLIRELKNLGSIPVQTNNHLTGKTHWQSMEKHYLNNYTSANRINATFEIIYGHAFIPMQKKTEQGTLIPLTLLRANLASI